MCRAPDFPAPLLEDGDERFGRRRLGRRRRLGGSGQSLSRRVVSLVPSITETLRAWGVEPVACTRFCEQPDLPTVGGTKNPDLDAIAALRPDIVLMDTEENRREDADALASAGVAVHATQVRSVADVGDALRGLASVIDLPDPDLETVPSFGALGISAFVPIWRRPWMTINAATYGSSLLEVIGVRNVFAEADYPYPTVRLDEAAAREPDVVLAPSEPYVFRERHRSELEAVAPVVFVDGRDLFWWGVRTPAAAGRLWADIGRA